MSKLQKAQSKINNLANWLDGRDWPSESLGREMEKAQARIDRITDEAIDATLRNMERFIESAQISSGDQELSARDRQMAQTDLKRLHKTARELRSMKS